MPDLITLRIEASVVRRYDAAARQLRKRIGGNLPSVEDLIRRELSQRTAAGIVDDFLQSDLPGRKRRGGVRRVKKPR